MSTDLNPDRAVSTTNTREVTNVSEFVEVVHKRFNGAASQAQDVMCEEVTSRDVPRCQSPDQNGATLLQKDPRALMLSRGFNA